MRGLGLLLFASCFIGSNMAQGEDIRVADLRCEYLNDPLGVDALQPRLSWIIESNQRGHARLPTKSWWRRRPNCWHKTKAIFGIAARSLRTRRRNVVYGGKDLLQSRQACHWKVRAWDRDGKPFEWVARTLGMGLLKPDDWQAKWIEAKPAEKDEKESLAGAKWIWCPEVRC